MPKVAFNTLIYQEDLQTFKETAFLEKARESKNGKSRTQADVFRDMISLYKQHNTNM